MPIAGAIILKSCENPFNSVLIIYRGLRWTGLVDWPKKQFLYTISSRNYLVISL